jgi:hypothetical protein
MSSQQKRVFVLLAAASLIFFIFLFFPNATGADNEKALAQTSHDEPVTYHVVKSMLQPGLPPKLSLARFIYYADYHYGYPFYFYSALVVLPVRLIYSSGWTAHTLVNLLLLRQMVSVLPMILAALLLVYLQTRFRSIWPSLGLLILLLSMRGAFRNDIHWWHPDALAILAVVLTLFFLDRDRLRFGRNFYFAAVACGIATSIKLLGVFFAFAILAYLVAGLATHKINVQRGILAGALFIAVMGATTVLTNPFLISSGARERMLAIQQSKAQELQVGYPGGDPATYLKGPQYWGWTLENWYGSWLTIGFLMLSLVLGCFWGSNTFLNRLILLWVVPYSLYLFYFVAPKPDHYMLPAMLPLFSAALTLPDAVRDLLGRIRLPAARVRLLGGAVTALVVLVLCGQVVVNVARPYSGNYVLARDAIVQTTGQ